MSRSDDQRSWEELSFVEQWLLAAAGGLLRTEKRTVERFALYAFLFAYGPHYREQRKAVAAVRRAEENLRIAKQLEGFLPPWDGSDPKF